MVVLNIYQEYGFSRPNSWRSRVRRRRQGTAALAFGVLDPASFGRTSKSANSTCLKYACAFLQESRRLAHDLVDGLEVSGLDRGANRFLHFVAHRPARSRPLGLRVKDEPRRGSALRARALLRPTERCFVAEIQWALKGRCLAPSIRVRQARYVA
jgi:hypothetical protein